MPPNELIRSRVNYLRHLLGSLPDTVPTKAASDSVYKFHRFSPNYRWINSEGVDNAANRELEARLGPRTGPRDTFVIKERGPGLEPLADVLQVHIGKFPDDVRFTKWLEDACRAAENVFSDANQEVSTALSSESVDVLTR